MENTVKTKIISNVPEESYRKIVAENRSESVVYAWISEHGESAVTIVKGNNSIEITKEDLKALEDAFSGITYAMLAE